ncbi:MAG: undecaprenyl-diphosphate phosphatase [Armatimonadota bacterium]
MQSETPTSQQAPREQRQYTVLWYFISFFVLFGGAFAFALYRHPVQPGSGLSVLQAVILGLVEGITEYLPVSSTGHLLLTQYALRIVTSEQSKEAINAYEIVIQAGAILAVLLLYTGRVRKMLAGVLGRDVAGRRLAINTLVAFLPAAIIGFLFSKIIKLWLFGLWPVTVAWLVGGLVILLIARRRGPTDGAPGKELEDLTVPQALTIGGLQCIAMWPGVSRSLTTILGGMLVGLSTAAAVEFSFLLGLVTLGAATLYDTLKHGSEIVQHLGWLNPLIGFAVACLSAMLAVKWMVGYLNRHSLNVFGYYRIALAIIIGALVLAGVLTH